MTQVSFDSDVNLARMVLPASWAMQVAHRCLCSWDKNMRAKLGPKYVANMANLSKSMVVVTVCSALEKRVSVFGSTRKPKKEKLPSLELSGVRYASFSEVSKYSFLFSPRFWIPADWGHFSRARSQKRLENWYGRKENLTLYPTCAFDILCKEFPWCYPVYQFLRRDVWPAWPSTLGCNMYELMRFDCSSRRQHAWEFEII